MRKKMIFAGCVLILLFSFAAYSASQTYTFSFQKVDAVDGRPIECTFTGTLDESNMRPVGYAECKNLGGGNDEEILGDINDGKCRKKTVVITKELKTAWVSDSCVEAYGECLDCETPEECRSKWASCQDDRGKAYTKDRCIDFAYGGLNQQQCEGGGKRRLVVQFPTVEGVEITECETRFGSGGTYNGCGQVRSNLVDVGKSYTVTINFKANGVQKRLVRSIYLAPEEVS